MPWWIQPSTGDHRQVQTLYTYDENDQEIAPKLLPMKTTVPGPEWWPLRFIMHSKHKIIPDIATGPRSGMMLVSSKVKAMIEKIDPVQHHYIPLEIRRKNGTLVEQEFYLFKFGSFVDGVVIEQSQVHKKIDSDGELWGLGSSISAKFVWRASAIKGRHIWGDKYLINDVFCSDEFMAELEQQKIKAFNKIKSYVATEH
jgi:hypothetical protein